MKHVFRLTLSLDLSRRIIRIVVLMVLTAASGRAAIIKGVAYDKDSGIGLPGVSVTLRALGKPLFPPQVQWTRSDGTYLFDKLAPGSYRLEFVKVGHIVVVPFREPIRVAAEPLPPEDVRVYPNPEVMSAERIQIFLGERSRGSPQRYKADLAALKSTASDPRMRAMVARIENESPEANRDMQVRKTDGMIATITRGSQRVTIKKEDNSPPTTWQYGGSTTIVDSRGRNLPTTALRPDIPVTIHYDKKGGARKIVLHESVEQGARQKETAKAAMSKSNDGY
jgi:hypothetical protein